MNTSGEAAEQIVRMSLEGVEIAAKISGAGAKNIAILLYTILKEEKKTNGKARLTSMLRSGKELKVFTVKNADLETFTKEAKKYGVLYCVLADRKNKDPYAEVDVIARAEDAPKISRIVERFHLASVGKGSVLVEPEKEGNARGGKPGRGGEPGEEGQPGPDAETKEKDKLMDALLGTPAQEEKAVNPLTAETGSHPLSEPISGRQMQSAEETIKAAEEKPSVKKELQKIREGRRESEQAGGTGQEKKGKIVQEKKHRDAGKAAVRQPSRRNKKSKARETR